MRLRNKFALVCAALLSAGVAAPLHAQSRFARGGFRALVILVRQRAQARPPAPPREVVPSPAAHPNNTSPAKNQNKPQANTLPPRAFQRLQSMTPQQQERFLQNNRRFQNLPPQEQDQIRQRLQEWNKLTPGQQQELRVRQRIWENMTPEQRRNVQQMLLPRWQQLPADRQKVILQHLHTLRDMTEPERNAKLGDPMFLQGMNADDREMLKQFAHLHVGMAPDPPGY